MMYAADGVGLAAPQVRREGDRERERERERVCISVFLSFSLFVVLSLCSSLSPSILLDLRNFDIKGECLRVVDMIGSDRRRFNAIIS